MVFGVAVLLLQLFLAVHDGGGHRPAMFPVLISHLMGGVRAGVPLARPIHNCAITTTITHITALVSRNITDSALVVMSRPMDADPPPHKLIKKWSNTINVKLNM